MVPANMKALVTTGNGHFELRSVSVPTPGLGEILVKVFAVAQNPTDWKTVALLKQEGNVIGCDFSGTVLQIGSGVPEDFRKVGERVAGAVHGGIGPNGAFAEYLVVPAALVFTIPESWTFEQAAQLGIPCYTACQCLYQYLQLPTPLEPLSTDLKKSILIWSGASATGQYVIQLAKLAGLRVLATSSPKNFDFIKSLGADDVFDYADSRTCKKVFTATQGTLSAAVDCYSDGMSPAQVSNSLSKAGGRVAFLLPRESMKKGVETKFIISYTIFGKTIEFPFAHAASPEHHANAIVYSRLISEVITKFDIRPVPVKILPHGLASVEEGFEYMKHGQVHAEKITYRLADTPGLATADVQER